jgi:ubiquitin-conjugating enzyme E2 Q
MDFDKVNNLFQWIVELHSFDPSLPLARDMKEARVRSIVLEIRFGKDYPMSPPFVRVIRPRFLPYAQGGGGHITSGGALCMELLTNSGWSPANSMESVFLQVRMAMCSVDPKPGRLQSITYPQSSGTAYSRSDYGVAEAIEAYIRAANVHGWKVPADLQTTANGGQTASGNS